MARKSNISYEIKLKSVQEYLKGEKSIIKLSSELGISQSQIREWVRKYNINGTEDLKEISKNTFYPPEIKNLAVIEYFTGKASMVDICSKYNISSHSILLRWIVRYNNHNEMKSNI